MSPMNAPESFQAEIWKEHFTEGEPFFLKGAKVVHTKDNTYDDDRMVVLTISRAGEDAEYTIWGRYLVAQVENADASDFGKPWKIVTTVPPWDETQKPGRVLFEADEEVPF